MPKLEIALKFRALQTVAVVVTGFLFTAFTKTLHIYSDVMYQFNYNFLKENVAIL